MGEILMWIGLGYAPLGILAWSFLATMKGTRNFAQECPFEIIATPAMFGLIVAAIGFVIKTVSL